MKRNALKLTCVMRVPYANAMFCMVVRTTAADGRRTESARPEEREGEHLDKIDARVEDHRRERDALRGREDGSSRWPLRLRARGLKSMRRNTAAKLTRVSRITAACECGRCPCKKKVTGDKGEREREREGVTC